MTLGIRKNAYDSATNFQKKVLKYILENVELGNPAIYQTASAVQWCVFDDDRIDMTDIAYLACSVEKLTSLTQQQQDALLAMTNEELRNAAKSYLQNNIVLPIDGQTPQQVIDANFTGNYLRADNQVPSGLII